MRRLLLGLILCICWNASIVQAETLSLRQALVLGMDHNFDLQIASLDVARAEAGIMSEQGRFDISAELAVGVSQSETPVASTVITEDSFATEGARAEAALSRLFASGLQTRISLSSERSNADTLGDRLDPAYRTSLVLDFTQPLLKDWGVDVNTANIEIARTRRQQVALEYLAKAQQLATEIERAYLDLGQADAEYRFATLARDLAEELLEGNQRKLDAGLVPVTEVNEARSAMAGREESMLLVQQKVALARDRLLELIDHGEAELPLNWQAASPDVAPLGTTGLSEVLAIAYKQRPDLKQARLDIDVRKIALVYADNQRLPRLDLEASLGINGLAGDDNGARYDGEWQNSIDTDGNSWYAGLRFSMPLQNRTAKAHYRDAAAQDKQSLYRLRRVEVSVETAVRSAHTVLELGRERLEVAQRYAALAQTTLDQETRRLQEGLSNTFRVLTFQNALVTARTREVAAQTDYARSQAALALAMGTNLERYDIFAALPHEGAKP